VIKQITIKIEPYDGESSYEECKDDNLPIDYYEKMR